MMNRYCIVVGLFSLAGCSAQPTSCADAATTSVVLELLSKQLGKIADAPEAAVRSMLVLNFPVAVSKDESVKRLVCEGQLEVAGESKTMIGFTSQRDDAGANIVGVREISMGDSIAMVSAVRSAVEKQASAAAPTKGSEPAPAVPASGFAALVGVHPAEAVTDAALGLALQNALGDRFSDFEDRLQVSSEVQRDGDFVHGSGCMPKLCTEEEAAFAIDVNTGAVTAAILSGGQIQTFGATTKTLPAPLRAWFLENGGQDKE